MLKVKVFFFFRYTLHKLIKNISWWIKIMYLYMKRQMTLYLSDILTSKTKWILVTLSKIVILEKCLLDYGVSGSTVELGLDKGQCQQDNPEKFSDYNITTNLSFNCLLLLLPCPWTLNSTTVDTISVLTLCLCLKFSDFKFQSLS